MLTEKMYKIEDLNEALVSLLDGKDFMLGLEKACRIIGHHLGGDYLFLVKTSDPVPEKMDLDVQLVLIHNANSWEVTPSPFDGILSIDAPSVSTWVQRYKAGQIILGSLENYSGQNKGLFQSMGIAHFIHLPIRVDCTSWGVLTITANSPQENWGIPQTDAVKPLLLAIGNLLARKIVEGELKAQRDYLRKLIDHIPSLIFAKDAKGHFIMANKSVAEAYNTTPEAMIGKKDIDFNIHLEEVQKFQKEDLTVIQTQQILFIPTEVVMHGRENARFYQTVKVPLTSENGEVTELIGIATDITYQKEIEKRIAQEKRLLETITGTTPDVIALVDLEKRKIIYSNLQGDFLGYDFKRIADNLEFFLQLIHPNDHRVANTDFIENLKKAKDEETIEAEYRVKDKDQQWLWFHERAKVFKRKEDGSLSQYIAFLQNINEKKKNEAQMLESEALQKAALKALPDLKFRINKAGIFIDIYPSTTQLPGIYADPQKFFHKSIYEMMPAYLAKGLAYNLQKTLTSKEVQRFEYALPGDGQLTYFEARFSAIDQEEVIMVIRDISERKKFQETLQEKYRELDLKNRQLQKYIDSNMQLENFAYIASHDLREPIRTMRTFAQMLQKRYGDQLDEAAKSYLGFIVDGAHNMNQLIEDLLTYSRVNTEQLVFEPIQPSMVIAEVIQDLDSVIQQKGAIIHFQNVPNRIQGNLTRMKQLFQNLLANAIKFSHLDKPPIIHIEAKDTGLFWQFSLADNGIGIEEEFFDKIFLLFKKLHSRKDFHGTGIGLALCKTIVTQHGGEIWLESIPDKGTTFHFTILKQL